MATAETISDQGLSSNEAEKRLRKLGEPPETSSRSTSSIVAGNVFTLFNAIIGVFFVLDLGLGLYADSLFGVIAIVNSYIGIRQELNAKKTLDELAVLVAPRAKVVRRMLDVADVVWLRRQIGAVLDLRVCLADVDLLLTARHDDHRGEQHDERAEDRSQLPAAHEPGAVGGAPELERRRPLDERLVEVEERRAARALTAPRARAARARVP